MNGNEQPTKELATTMGTLVTHVNKTELGHVETAQERRLAPTMPVSCTPAAVVGGVALTAAAFGAGFAAEETADD